MTREIQVPQAFPQCRPCDETIDDDRCAVAYVVPVEHDGWFFYSIHGEDGLPLAVAPSRGLAFAAIRQFGMQPVDAH